MHHIDIYMYKHVNNDLVRRRFTRFFWLKRGGGTPHPGGGSKVSHPSHWRKVWDFKEGFISDGGIITAYISNVSNLASRNSYTNVSVSSCCIKYLVATICSPCNAAILAKLVGLICIHL